MRRPIVIYPDPILQTKAVSVTRVDDRVRELVRDMFETMYGAEGVGLAAPQVGVSRRVIVVDVSPVEKERPPLALINPVLAEGRGLVEGKEGCLSLPGVEGLVSRFESVVVTGRNERGEPVRVEASGFLARALQHEIDHLDGVLFVDRMSASAASAK